MRLNIKHICVHKKTKQLLCKEKKSWFGCIRKLQVKKKLYGSPPYNIYSKANLQLYGLRVWQNKET